MPLSDPDSGNVNDAAFGIDTTAANQGEQSIFSNLSDMVTKGVPLTGLSIVNSFANTGIDVANWFGAGINKLTMEDEVGDGTSMDQYYKQHQEGIETAGLIAGSLIPGTIAVKALKLAQLGRMGETLASAVNIFNGPKERLISDAANAIEDPASLFNTFNADKYKAIALGFGDQALQALTYQVATAATMKASPILDKQSLSDLVQNTFFGTLVGAGIGGTIEGIGIRGIFNKAYLNADLSSKAQDLATYVGMGPYVAGDKAAALVDSIEEIPEPTNLLESGKFSGTRDNAYLNARSILKSITPEGNDPDLSNTFFNSLMKMRTEGGLDRDGLYNYLARLSKITRINGDDAGVPDGTAFYINRIAKGETYGENDLITAVPRYNFTGEDTEAADAAAIKNAGTSLRYQLKPGSYNFRIAKYTDATNWGNTPLPLFETAQDAWDNGYDLYVNRNNQISINPEAPNLQRVARPGENRILTVAEEKLYRKTGQLPEGKKLTGAPLVLDTQTGGVSEKALPVVGDFGKVTPKANGVEYGENFSPQSIDSPLTPETKAIDANARYVWAANRGILSGDKISPDDVPMLEQMYRAGLKANKPWHEYIGDLNKQDVGFTDGSGLPYSEQDMLNKIQGAKNKLISRLLAANPKLSSEEAAQIAGVKEDYIANNMQSDKVADFISNPEESATLKHVKLWYDIGNVNIYDGQIARGALDTQYRINVIQGALKSVVAKYFGEGFGRFISNSTSADANIKGVGAKFLSSSQAPYDSLGQEMERIGRNVTNWYQQQVRKVSTALSAPANAIRDDEQASAELGMFRAVRQRTSERYTFLPKELAQKYGLAEADGSSNIAVLDGSLVRDKTGNILDWNKDYIPENFRSGDNFSYDDAVGNKNPGNYTYYRLSPKVANWEYANLQLNNARIVARNNFYAANGLAKKLPLNTLYTPPINTSKYPFFALVKLPEGTGMGEDDVAAITADTENALKEKIASLRGQNFSVYTKEDLKQYHQIMGDYEYSRNFAQTQVNSALKAKGILNDVLPETRGQGIIQDYVDWHNRQEMLLTRDYTELANAQLFAELKEMGSRFVNAETSRTGFVPTLLAKQTANPYQGYVNTALAISSRESYRVWGQAQEVLESTFNTAFNTAKRAFIAAKKGVIPFEQASEMATRFGLGNVYGNSLEALKSYYNIANKLPDTPALSNFVSTANSILGATVIKLDTFQQMIHILSTPILTLAEANSAREYLTTQLPGTEKMIPATSKIFFQALNDYFKKPIFDSVMPLYKREGFIRDPDILRDHYELLDQLTLPYGKFSQSGITQKISSATKIAERLTGTRFSEAYTSWMAARTAHLLFESVGYSGRGLLDNIGSFVNRARANIIASQRPVAFQGPLGQAIGLFQTYYFNLMQQVFRYVENNEYKTLAIAGGLQTALFGMSSLPGFQAINTHIVGMAAGNNSNADLYSATSNFFGKELGDYLLYGVTSNWLNAGLYSRGDINPRQITLLPVNPLNYPAISGGIRFLSNLINTEERIRQGGNIEASFLLGLEHNGLSRPLMGLAQLVQGYSTTAAGNLIASTSPQPVDNSIGLSDLYDAGVFSRLLGARPLDEAVHLDLLYRTGLYKAKDNARIESLGEAAKTTMYDNQFPNQEEVSNFSQQYAAAGGDIGQFGRKMIEWSQGANTSVANKIFQSLKDPRNQQAMLQMGGMPLPDFRNQYSTAPSGVTPWLIPEIANQNKSDQSTQ